MKNIIIKKGEILTIAIAAFLSLSVVVGLFFLMKSLITKDFGESEVRKPQPIPTIINPPEDPPDTVLRPPKIKKPEEVEPPPPDVKINNEDKKISITSGKYKGVVDKTFGADFNPGTVDGDLFPITIPQPQYPTRAAERGIEGYVILSFDVLKDGTTANHEIVKNAKLMSDGSFREGAGSIFNKSAIMAAKRLKYKAKIINGKAVEVIDQHYKFTFQLDN